MEPVAIALAIEMVAEGFKHLVRPRYVGLALPPVGTQAVEVGWAHASLLAGQLLVEPERW